MTISYIPVAQKPHDNVLKPCKVTALVLSECLTDLICKITFFVDESFRSATESPTVNHGEQQGPFPRLV